MQESTVAELTTAAGRRAVEAAASGRRAGTDLIALSTRLRREHPAELVAAALTQAALQERAATRFDPADAARLLFTVDGYEQATRAAVARRRARLIADRLGTGTRVLDLCCGIGGDLVELVRAGLTVTGVDVDPVVVALARANLAALDLAGSATVTRADVTGFDRSGADAVVCDPARREATGPGGSRRSFRLADYRPPWSFVQELLGGTACVKVGPAIDHDDVPDTAHAEWVSDGGTVVEATLWSGSLRPSALARSATVLPAGATMTTADAPAEVASGAPGGYVYEPDPAVIRAGLVTGVVALTDGWLLDPRIAYVSSDEVVDTPFGRGYRVREVLPLDRKLLRRRLAELDVGTLTVKKRGLDLDPARLRTELRPRGSRALTLIATRVDGTVRAILTDPLPRTAPAPTGPDQ